MDADTNICAVILNYNDAQTTMKLTESKKQQRYPEYHYCR